MTALRSHDGLAVQSPAEGPSRATGMKHTVTAPNKHWTLYGQWGRIGVTAPCNVAESVLRVHHQQGS